MRRLHPYALAFLVLTLFLQQIVPQSQPSSQPSTNAASGHSKPKQEHVNCTNNGTYTSKGQTVPRPENCSAAPKGATAQCRDGSYSFSRTTRGTCSHVLAQRELEKRRSPLVQRFRPFGAGIF
jgi:hypothetical protein